MTDDTRKKKDSDKSGDSDSGFGEDSDLGNLPPLSDFESSMGKADSDLPPLGDIDSDSDSGKGKAAGGLPPLSEISVETPSPTGGRIKAAPPGFEGPQPPSKGALDTPSDADIDTPQTASGTSFQDLAADSDFSPETPEIGPGPDSDVETPLFDSAFGAGFGSPAETPAPTQAMETPMFEPAVTPSPQFAGFDEGAFGSAKPGGPEPGTPIPDFSPDTGIPAAAAPPATPTPAPKRKAKAPGGSRMSGVLVGIVVFIVALGIGVVVGPRLSFIPNPDRATLAETQQKLQTAERERALLQKQVAQAGEVGVSGSIEEIIKQKQGLVEEIAQLQEQQKTTTADLDKSRADLDTVQQDLNALNDEFATRQESYEELQNNMAILQARYQGLDGETQRLTNQVGLLEDANARRLATKDTLAHDIQRLEILVKEGCPLTPAKYDHDKRVAAVDELKEKVQQAKWVTPELLDEYSSLYLDELAIAQAHDYFFARIPVKDRFETVTPKWAECLMNGNWSVSYVTIDGKNVGYYTNTASSGAPNYQFTEVLDPKARANIEAGVQAARVPDYEEKIKVLEQRQEITEGTKPFQHVFDSLM